jgi:uncharacterized protein YecE (DUF72 family)
MLWIGTSGWSYRHWRGLLYPPGLSPRTWFAYYVRHFPTVEINASFYRLPSRQQFARWAEMAAARPGFRFAVKASRLITHVRRLAEARDELARLLQAAEGLGPMLAVVLFQLPPGFERDLERLHRFLAQLPQYSRFAVEFRHPSWFEPAVLELVAARGGAVVIALGGRCPTPEELPFTGPFGYVRVHHGSSGIGLADEEIAALAARLEQLASSGREGYVYFNNDAWGHAVDDARRLREELTRLRVAVA